RVRPYRRAVRRGPLAQPGAWTAGGVRRAAGGHPRRRDRDPGRRPGARVRDRGGQPGPVRAERSAAGPRTARPRLHGGGRSVPERDDPARDRDPAAATYPADAALRLPAAHRDRPELRAVLAAAAAVAAGTAVRGADPREAG